MERRKFFFLFSLAAAAKKLVLKSVKPYERMKETEKQGESGNERDKMSKRKRKRTTNSANGLENRET